MAKARRISTVRTSWESVDVASRDRECPLCGVSINRADRGEPAARREVTPSTYGGVPVRESSQRTTWILAGTMVLLAVALIGALFGGGILRGKGNEPVRGQGVPAAVRAETRDANAPAAPAAPAPETVTVTSTVMAPAPAPPDGTPSQHLYRQVFGIPGYFTHAGTLHPTTSQEFLEAVAYRYAELGADGASTSMTVYSTSTREWIPMNCVDQLDATVICTGGRNAAIIL